ncbi:MAG: LysM peptidoglycan-binding domain-containing protein [bacterium]|nr:LysM peptidoglycan-binding domain-containing protein [bacterium]
MLRQSRTVIPVLIVILLGPALLGGCRSTAGGNASPTAVLPVPDPAPAPAPDEQMPAEPAAAVDELAGPAEERDYADLQRQAMDACDAAEQFLDEGAIDAAIAALDRAYELMLALAGTADPALIEERDALRLLIAERLVHIYAAQRTAAGQPRINWDLEIALVTNAEVQREIASFQGGERELFLAAFRRSGRYRPMILEKLAAAGLPSQLSWLPMIESQFKVRALSRASALGLWQFIRSTGNRFGLKRDTWVDERLDPEKSTAAAIAYLTELHDLFGDWPKAMAAYNCGEHRILRLDRQRPGEALDFWDLYRLLPSETRRYIPRFFATLLILEAPEKYGFELPEPDPPLSDWAVVTTQRPHELKQMERLLAIPEGTLAELNPELRQRATPNHPYELRVPRGHDAKLADQLAQLPEWKPPQPEYTSYRVRPGDTLSTIARRFGTSASAIARLNGIRNQHRIGIGKRLRIPTRGRSSPRPELSSAQAAALRKALTAGDGEASTIAHTVASGDTLYDIANLYRTTVGQIKSDNNLRSDRLYPGQTLNIRPASRNGGVRLHVVKPGDTPIAIARAYRVSVRELLRLNGLSERSKIYPRQTLLIP